MKDAIQQAAAELHGTLLDPSTRLSTGSLRGFYYLSVAMARLRDPNDPVLDRDLVCHDLDLPDQDWEAPPPRKSAVFPNLTGTTVAAASANLPKTPCRAASKRRIPGPSPASGRQVQAHLRSPARRASHPLIRIGHRRSDDRRFRWHQTANTLSSPRNALSGDPDSPRLSWQANSPCILHAMRATGPLRRPFKAHVPFPGRQGHVSAQSAQTASQRERLGQSCVVEWNPYTPTTVGSPHHRQNPRPQDPGGTRWPTTGAMPSRRVATQSAFRMKASSAATPASSDTPIASPTPELNRRPIVHTGFISRFTGEPRVCVPVHNVRTLTHRPSILCSETAPSMNLQTARPDLPFTPHLSGSSPFSLPSAAADRFLPAASSGTKTLFYAQRDRKGRPRDLDRHLRSRSLHAGMAQAPRPPWNAAAFAHRFRTSTVFLPAVDFRTPCRPASGGRSTGSFTSGQASPSSSNSMKNSISTGSVQQRFACIPTPCAFASPRTDGSSDASTRRNWKAVALQRPSHPCFPARTAAIGNAYSVMHCPISCPRSMVSRRHFALPTRRYATGSSAPMPRIA